MRQHKDLAFIDANISNPIDSPLEQITFSASKSETDNRGDMAPANTAAFLLTSRAIRSEQFRDVIPDIDDIFWHILLDLTVATSSGKAVTVHDLAETHNVAMSTMSRYVDYLIRVRLIDENVVASDGEAASLKLSASGNALTNKTLMKISGELANL